MTPIPCPKCKKLDHWRAIEQHHCTVNVEFHDSEDGIEIEQSARSEFVREGASATVISYFCEACGYTVAPESLRELKEASVEEAPVRKPHEPEAEFSARKSRWEGERLDERRAKAGASAAEDPLVKFGRVFSG